MTFPARALRRSLCVVVVALSVVVVAPSVASAAVTTTSITSPTDPYLGAFDYQGGLGPFSVTITGTTDSTAPATDQVDVRCYPSPTGSQLVIPNVALNPDKTFSVLVDATALPSLLCRLRAVPAGTTPMGAALAPFSGPRVYKSELDDLFRVGASSPNAGIAYDFYASTSATGRTGFMDFDSLGSCGLDDSYVYDPASDVRPNALFYCNGYLSYRDNFTDPTSTRSQLQIDGANAYNSYTADSLFEDNAGLPPLSYKATRDPGTGDLTIDEAEDIVKCPMNTFPATAASCAQFVKTGVAVKRHIVVDHGARVATLTDSWSSTDGAAHQLDALYENDFVNPDAGFRFPWVDADYATHTAGDTKPGAPSAPASILVKGKNTAPDGDPTDPQGAITFSTAPNSVRFIGVAATSSFLLGYLRQVPASGALTITQTYSDGPTLAEVSALAREAEDRQQGPAVSITTPAPGARTSASSLTVAGTATDNVAVTSLTVGGVATPVGAAGAFSRAVPLAPGANTIAAVARDGQGNAAQAMVTVTRTVKPKPKSVVCRVPRVRGKAPRSARRALKRAHCGVGRTIGVRVAKAKRGHRSLVGRVVKTKPGARRRLRAGAKITLYVGVAKRTRRR